MSKHEERVKAMYRETIEVLVRQRNDAEGRVAELERVLREVREYIEPRVRGKKGGQSYGETFILPLIDDVLENNDG